MSLSTFFKVATGQYSDDQIRAAAAAYYGRTAAAAVAAVNNDITVNVNIDGETVTRFKPEQGAKPEKQPEPPKQPEKQPEKKQPEKQPEPPKQPEKQPEKKQPEKQPEKKQPEKQPEPPKQPEKQPEKKQPEKQPEPPKQPEKKPEPPKQPEKQSKAEQQDVTAQQAAHPVTGFNIAAFQAPQQTVSVSPTQSAPIQQSQPMPAMPLAAPVSVYPANYREMTPEQRCDHLVGIINCGLLPPMHNPRPDLTIEQKVVELKKHITFMDMPGRQIGQIRINSLLNMISSQSLKNAISKNDAVDRANNPKLSEVPVSKYATGDQIVRFDMAFEIKLKDPKKILVVLYSTVPMFDPIQSTWSGDLTIFVKEI